MYELQLKEKRYTLANHQILIRKMFKRDDYYNHVFNSLKEPSTIKKKLNAMSVDSKTQ